MLKFSFGLPKRYVKRLPNAPQISDLHEMLTHSMEETEKDYGISWAQSGFEFKLVVRHRGSQLLWRLMFGSGLASQVVWNTHETNVRTVFSQVIARCNDLARSSKTQNESVSAASDQTKRISQKFSNNAGGTVSGGAVDAGAAAMTNKSKHSHSPEASVHNDLSLKPPGQRGVLQSWQIEGDLACVRTFMLLQSLCQSGCRGRLEINTPADVGEIYFDKGRIIHAAAGVAAGADAILEILGWDSGSYRFEREVAAPVDSIGYTWENVMSWDMELLRMAKDLEDHGVQTSSFVCRSNNKLADGELEHLMQKSVAIKRVFLTVSEPLTILQLIERVQLPRSQFVPALTDLLANGWLMWWNEDQPQPPSQSQQDQPDAVHGAKQSKALDRFAFREILRAKTDWQDELWIQALSTPGGMTSLVKRTQPGASSGAAISTSSLASAPPSAPGQNQQCDEQHMLAETRQFAQAALDFMTAYSVLFNRYIVDPELTVTPSEIGDVTEPAPKNKGEVQKNAPVKFYRWRAGTALWSLNCRARENIIEIYLVPARECVLLSAAEQEFRRKAKLEYVETVNGAVWSADGLPVSAGDVRLLLRGCFRELVRTTITDFQFQDFESDNHHHQSYPTAPAYALQHMKQIILEKQNLAQKIVSQQEEIQRRIARDLHDAVIADVTMLKRSLGGESRTDHQSEIVKSLEQIIHRLREICYDLSPSDLRDWGLQTTIEALLDQVSQRTGADCELICKDELPALEGPVELHIFRIIQEALNNSAKYSEASFMSITTEIEEGWLVFKVEDNGKGFSQELLLAKGGKDGGMGIGSMQERAQLIQGFYPSRLEIRSQPGRGSITKLSIKVPANMLGSRQDETKPT